MNTLRRCKVAITSADGVVHSVEVTGTSLFEVAAAGLSQMREEGWIGAVAPTAVIRVEVQLAPIVHEVPVNALERWADAPSVSPREEMVKRKVR